MAKPRYRDPALAAIQARYRHPVAPPWLKPTTARHTDHDGNEWAVIVDWVAHDDGTPVPAAVSITSVGGTYGDPVVAQPLPVTRAVIDSVPWGEVIWGSRKAVTGSTRRVRPDTRDHRLRQVADLYRELGGPANPRVALDLMARLESLGVRPRGGGDLTRETVRRWIKEARQRGHLPPVTTERERHQ